MEEIVPELHAHKLFTVKIMNKFFILLALLTVVGCDHIQPQEVKAWQRDVLAREDMQLVPHPIQDGLDEHIYFSKEAASGGSGVGGGGCGCN